MAALCMSSTASVAMGSRAVAGKRVVARRSAAAPACATRSSTVVRAQAVAEPKPARLYNFSAGPACLPLDVLEEAKDDLINYKGTGMSVMEMSHRGKDFMKIAAEAEADLRELVGIPDNYKVRDLLRMFGASQRTHSNPPFRSGTKLCIGNPDRLNEPVRGGWTPPLPPTPHLHTTGHSRAHYSSLHARCTTSE